MYTSVHGAYISGLPSEAGASGGEGHVAACYCSYLRDSATGYRADECVAYTKEYGLRAEVI